MTETKGQVPDLRLGIDIGFGDVKCVTNTGLAVKFPTAVAPGNLSTVDLTGVRDAETIHTYSYRNRDWVVGEKAVPRAIPTRSIEFLLEFAPLLTVAAMRQMGVSAKVISAGLPLEHFAAHHETLKRSLSHMDVDGETYNQHVAVVPQGVGIFADWAKDEQGEYLDGSDKEGLVLDIGYNTIDIVAFTGRKPSAIGSRMLERQGISVITSELRTWVKKNHGVDISNHEAKAAFERRGIRIRTHEHDLSEFLEKATDAYFESLFHVVRDQWGGSMHRVEVLVAGGGGAHHLSGHVPDDLADQIRVVPEPEFSNARGFLKALLRPGGNGNGTTRKPGRIATEGSAGQ